MKASKIPSKDHSVQLHVIFTTRKFLYKARILIVLKTSFYLEDVSDASLPIIWVEIAQRLLSHAPLFADIVGTCTILMNCVHISTTNQGLEVILEAIPKILEAIPKILQAILLTPDQQVELNQLIVHHKKIDNQLGLIVI